MMRKVRGIIALDLDGTLLNSRKQLSSRNLYALEAAAEDGWEIVPATGRFYKGMPDFIRELPFVNYAITINGAEVVDLRRKRLVYEAEMPVKQAVKIMEWLDDYPVIYDCYMESHGWISQSHKDQVDTIVRDPHVRDMIHNLRTPVPDLKEFLLAEGKGVQKIQFFSADDMERIRMLDLMPRIFADVAVTTALDQNVEINQIHANKGEALMALAAYLGVDMKDTIAIGDGTNDLPMIHAAGVGIGMANGSQRVKEECDWATQTNDKDGVAMAIERYCL
ncbi:MAG: HAD family phosphatase [Firmicutes bacterium]|nr:HAD family phosphatase [Bacillota bacterium]